MVIKEVRGEMGDETESKEHRVYLMPILGGPVFRASTQLIELQYSACQL